MIHNVKNTELQRDGVIEHCKHMGYERVLDLGGVLGPWASEVVTHYADCMSFSEVYEEVGERAVEEMKKNKPFFYTDLNKPETWDALLQDVKKNGRFYFIICTQVLEHLYNPEMCLTQLIPQLSERGFIGVPNKVTELTKKVYWEQPFRGFLPHRWIFSLRLRSILHGGDSTLWAFPKLNFLEYVDLPWVEERFTSVELSFYFKGEIPIHIIEDRVLDHGSPYPGIAYYLEELPKGL